MAFDCDCTKKETSFYEDFDGFGFTLGLRTLF